MNSDPNDVVSPPRCGTDQPELYHVYHETGSGEQLSTSVVDAIADATGVNPTETRIPLRDVVNPDALDALFDRSSPGSRRERSYLMLRIWELTVMIHGNGHIVAVPDSA